VKSWQTTLVTNCIRGEIQKTHCYTGTKGGFERVLVQFSG